MFLDRVIHFGETLGDQVKVRSPKKLQSLIEVPPPFISKYALLPPIKQAPEDSPDLRVLIRILAIKQMLTCKSKECLISDDNLNNTIEKSACSYSVIIKRTKYLVPETFSCAPENH